MNTNNREFVEFVEKEITSIVLRFVNIIEECKAAEIAKEIVSLIDWNDSALMHKGLSWMTKNYLTKNKIM